MSVYWLIDFAHPTEAVVFGADAPFQFFDFVGKFLSGWERTTGLSVGGDGDFG